MGRVKSFKLKKGTRVGSYEIDHALGRGWEGEVYAVREVPTDAKRAMKLISRANVDSTREIIHAAWFFEQVAGSGSVARYYHMGHWFLDDDEGLFFLVFEKLDGKILKDFIADSKEAKTFGEAEALKLLGAITEKIRAVHALGYGIGDLETGENIVVAGKPGEPRPIFCDLNPGQPDHPNEDFAADAKELIVLARLIFDGVERGSKAELAFEAMKAASKRPGDPMTFRELVDKLSGQS